MMCAERHLWFWSLEHCGKKIYPIGGAVSTDIDLVDPLTLSRNALPWLRYCGNDASLLMAKMGNEFFYSFLMYSSYEISLQSAVSSCLNAISILRFSESSPQYSIRYPTCISNGRGS